MSTTPIRRWRPPVVTDFPDWADERKRKSFIQQLDRNFQIAFDNTSTIESNYIGKTPTLEGKLVNWGTVAITGYGTVATGLTSIESILATIESDAALNEWVTVKVGTKAGDVVLYCWKPTATGDNTPIASTTGRTVHWQATGTG